MFHERVLHIPSKNLDTFFTDADQVRALYAMEQPGHDITVLEGVMGLFDGLGGTRRKVPPIISQRHSGAGCPRHRCARNGKIHDSFDRRLLQYDKSHLIKGVILNRTSKNVL